MACMTSPHFLSLTIKELVVERRIRGNSERSSDEER
jgi:hypothetical protein